MTFDSIATRINNIKVPEHWLADGSVVPPTEECKEKTIQVCRKLFEENELIPKTVAASCECVFLTYRVGDRKMIMEVLNNCSIGALVNDEIEKEILWNEDIVDMNFEKCLNVLNTRDKES